MVMTMRTLVLATVVALFAPGIAAAQDACANVAALAKSLQGTTIVSSKPVPASAQPRGPSIPAFCEVHATISPVPGSHIGAVYRLPMNWNGKVLGIGGGGFAGNLTLEAAAAGLSRGYAVIQNDLGHESTGALDPKFAITAAGKPNVDAIVDFGHRATHVATDVGKKLVSNFYGRPPQRSYWQGCSTGGRQGLAEVQRYPTDYDGVIAGAPVYNPLVYSNAILRVQAFHKKPESNLLPEHVPLIQKAVLAACDGKDGLADGIVTDPRSCTWDPGVLACKGAPGASCLTPAQVETVRTVYAGVKTKDGKFAAMPLMRGGEGDWVARMIGTKEQPRGLNSVLGAPFMSYIVKGDPSYDIMTFDPERDMKALSTGPAAEVHQENADISAFVRRGGKLLLWHGFNDPGPSPLSTIDYYDQVLQRVPTAKDSVRLFLAPGVGHCGGGPGPDRLDTLTAMEHWVEQGTPPGAMVAVKAGFVPFARPVCAYPQLPKYNGNGDPYDPANFRCAAP
jgi:feruloyl esterase